VIPLDAVFRRSSPSACMDPERHDHRPGTTQTEPAWRTCSRTATVAYYRLTCCRFRALAGPIRATGTWHAVLRIGRQEDPRGGDEREDYQRNRIVEYARFLGSRPMLRRTRRWLAAGSSRPRPAVQPRRPQLPEPLLPRASLDQVESSRLRFDAQGCPRRASRKPGPPACRAGRRSVCGVEVMRPDASFASVDQRRGRTRASSPARGRPDGCHGSYYRLRCPLRERVAGVSAAGDTLPAVQHASCTAGVWRERRDQGARSARVEGGARWTGFTIGTKRLCALPQVHRRPRAYIGEGRRRGVCARTGIRRRPAPALPEAYCRLGHSI
jgi:hypothetical protein